MTVYENIFELVRLIPYGKVTSYGLIAQSLEIKGGARQVGWAMNQAHTVEPTVPAHRVVNRKGFLSGKLHFATLTRMQELLEAEGIQIIDDQIQDFEKHLWLPDTIGDEWR
jgi:methylated-DNA-protein-cysteine methyltransferase related protein